MSRPSTRLHAVVTTLDGQSFRWDPLDRQRANRMTSVKKASKIMEGYADASVELPRAGDVPWADLGLYASLALYLDDGDRVYEGRIAAPEFDSASQRVAVGCASWMTHGRDRPMLPYIYMDQGMDRWGEMPAERLAVVGKDVASLQVQVQNGHAQILFPNQAITGSVRGEAWYTAPPGATADLLAYTAHRVSMAFGANVGIDWYDDPGSAAAQTTAGTYDNTARTATPTTGHRFIAMGIDTNGTSGTPNVGQMLDIYNLAVIGPHGLDYDSDFQLRASDIIKHSAAAAAPLLDTSLIPDTDYAVGQLVIADPTDPYDIWLGVNKYELRNLAVRGDRKMRYEVLDDTDADWYVRRADPAVRVKFDGAEIGQQANGIVVRFQNVLTGRADMVTPETNDELANSDPTLAANRAGIDAWLTIQLPDPDSPTGAARYGQKVLARFNAQRRSGKITIRGHVQDRAGAWHPVSKINDGDTVLVADDASETPRVIYEANYNYAADTVELAVDNQSKDADALISELLDAGHFSV